MTFPTVVTSATSLEDAANVTSHTVSLPSGIASGDLLVAVFVKDGSSSTITWPNEGTDWIVIANAFIEPSATTAYINIAYRKADGTEGASITVTTSASERSAHAVYRITGHEHPDTQAPEVSTTVGGTSTAPDPNSLTPTGGAKDYLWIAAEGHDRDRTTDAFPTNYTANQLNTAGGGANSAGVAAATRELNAASEDPGAFTISASDEWVAFTVAVHPVAGATDEEFAGSITKGQQLPRFDPPEVIPY